MQELFKELFKKYNIPNQKTEEFASGFSAIAMLKIMEITESKLSEEEKLAVKKALQEEDFKLIEKIILAKYSPEELDKIIESQIVPLFENYRKQVLNR